MIKNITKLFLLIGLKGLQGVENHNEQNKNLLNVNQIQTIFDKNCNKLIAKLDEKCQIDSTDTVVIYSFKSEEYHNFDRTMIYSGVHRIVNYTLTFAVILEILCHDLLKELFYNSSENIKTMIDNINILCNNSVAQLSPRLIKKINLNISRAKLTCEPSDLISFIFKFFLLKELNKIKTITDFSEIYGKFFFSNDKKNIDSNIVNYLFKYQHMK